MKRYEQNRRVAVVDLLRPVPVMDVPAEDRDPLHAVHLLRVATGDRDVVEQTEAHGPVEPAVMPGRSRQREQAVRSAVGVHRPRIDCPQHRARRPCRWILGRQLTPRRFRLTRSTRSKPRVHLRRARSRIDRRVRDRLDQRERRLRGRIAAARLGQVARRDLRRPRPPRSRRLARRRGAGDSRPHGARVAGCTDSHAAQSSRPALTALSLNPEWIGTEAVELLVTLVESGEAAEPHRIVPFAVIPRASTRASAGTSASKSRQRSRRARVR